MYLGKGNLLSLYTPEADGERGLVLLTGAHDEGAVSVSFPKQFLGLRAGAVRVEPHHAFVLVRLWHWLL